MIFVQINGCKLIDPRLYRSTANYNLTSDPNIDPPHPHVTTHNCHFPPALALTTLTAVLWGAVGLDHSGLGGWVAMWQCGAGGKQLNCGKHTAKLG